MRRVLLAIVVAVVLAVMFAACAKRQGHADTVVVMSDPCANLDPDGNWFLWWWYGCGDPAAGGGGSGAA